MDLAMYLELSYPYHMFDYYGYMEGLADHPVLDMIATCSLVHVHPEEIIKSLVLALSILDRPN